MASGAPQKLRRVTEYAAAFTVPQRIPTSDPIATAESNPSQAGQAGRPIASYDPIEPASSSRSTDIKGESEKENEDDLQSFDHDLGSSRQSKKKSRRLSSRSSLRSRPRQPSSSPSQSTSSALLTASAFTSTKGNLAHSSKAGQIEPVRRSKHHSQVYQNSEEYSTEAEIDRSKGSEPEERFESSDRRMRQGDTAKRLNDYDDWVVARQQQQEADYVVRPRVSTAKEVEPETDFYEEEEEHVDESQLAFQPEYGGGFSEEDFPLLDQASSNRFASSHHASSHHSSRPSVSVDRSPSHLAPSVLSSSSRSKTQSDYSRRQPSARSPNARHSHSKSPLLQPSLQPRNRRPSPKRLPPRKSHADTARARRFNDSSTNKFTNRKLDGNNTKEEERKVVGKLSKDVQAVLAQAAALGIPVGRRETRDEETREEEQEEEEERSGSGWSLTQPRRSSRRARLQG